MSTSARLASRCHTLLTTASSSSTSWLMTMSPPRWLVRKPRSQTIESASRWLVGSSSSSVSASENRMRASSTRRRCHRTGCAVAGRAPGRAGRGCCRCGRRRSRRRTRPCGELVLEPAVAAHGLVPLVVVGGFGHGDLRLGQLVAQHVESPPGEHPVAGGDVQVAAARVLREVTDLAGHLDLAGVRDALARERGEGGGLAGAVAAHQADPVAGLDAEVGVADEDAATGTQLEAGRRDH